MADKRRVSMPNYGFSPMGSKENYVCYPGQKGNKSSRAGSKPEKPMAPMKKKGY